MSSLIDLLELHAKEATKRLWRFTEDGLLLADIENPDECERVTIAAYGGWPVAESMATSDAILTMLAVNALPDLLKLARAVGALADFDCGALPEEALAGPDGRCVICATREALAPLLREVRP